MAVPERDLPAEFGVIIMGKAHCDPVFLTGQGMCPVMAALLSLV